jgi:hypothetical protein
MDNAFMEETRSGKAMVSVWFATREEIAEWYLKNHHTHIA